MVKLEYKIGDCLELMTELPDKSVDLVITSPPYNIGNDHHTGNNRHFTYEDDMEENEYQKWQKCVLDECYRILKDNGSMFYNHKNRIIQGEQITPYSWLLNTDFIIKQEIIWFNGSQNFDKIRFYPMTERVYWLTKSKKTTLVNNINHHDVFTRKEWPPVKTNGKHKRAFPVQMVVDIIKCFPDANMVCDPFLGSGTTLRACRETNRNCIGFEKEQKYESIIRKRAMLDTPDLSSF